MIVPLTYFIEKPFQNWTYENSAQIGSVFLHVDYTVPVDRLRRKLDEIVRESKLWDGNVANLQVTDTPIDMVELRALVSARNPGAAWNSALRGSRKADRLFAGGVSAGAAAATHGNHRPPGRSRLRSRMPTAARVARLENRSEPAPQH